MDGRMRRHLLLILSLLFFFFFLFLSPCSRANCEADEDRHISGYNQFGIRLLKQVLAADQGKNVFISPASVALALTMTYTGAEGTTQEAMARVLGIEDLSLEELNQANKALMQKLKQVDASIRLNIVNSLWARKGLSFKPEFIQANESDYEAEVRVVDFASHEVAGLINDWVSQKTQAKIDKIVDTISPSMILFLINAIYFKGEWTDPFDEGLTAERPFTLMSGKQKPHLMMSRVGRYSYQEGDAFQAAVLPYGNKNISMYVFLPGTESNLDEFLDNLSFEDWEHWISRFEDAMGLIMLPRFQLEYGKSLNDALIALGLEVAFDGDKANFGGMCPIPPNVCIGEVKHKTFVEVNEEGTEAAAVTSVTMVATSMAPPDKEFRMIVDRPFFFAIRDNQTGLILFMGVILDPK
jgi:serine protease inhibitor